MKIAFTDNYDDMSNEHGYQFKFYCEKCGNGYISSFQKSSTGAISGALNVVSGIFGGFTSNLANTSDDIHRMAAGPQHDAALEKAVEEISNQFKQCKRCGSWVCTNVCWNDERSLCKECAPELAEEMAAAQAQHSREEAFAHAHMSAKEKKLTANDWNDQKKAACPKCNASIPAHAKFCTECGESLISDKKCSNCGVKLEAETKFCPDCGQKAV